jgi:hypothetical protein
MDLHLKIEQAHEEITQLNVEICHVATYIHDEDHFLRYWEMQTRVTDPQLALHIKLH